VKLQKLLKPVAVAVVEVAETVTAVKMAQRVLKLIQKKKQMQTLKTKKMLKVQAPDVAVAAEEAMLMELLMNPKRLADQPD
jgi:hypothetical protein